MSTTVIPVEARLAAELIESIRTKHEVLEREMPMLAQIARMLTQVLRDGNKVLVFGNGGSAADSQHIAAELVGRFRRERRALPAIALTTDTSILTAVGNDYGFEDVFARQIEALGNAGDLALAISTSGNSPNVLKAVGKAKELGMITVGFSGDDGGKLKQAVDVCFRVPSRSTPRIQEAHIAAAHAICETVEAEFAAANS